MKRDIIVFFVVLIFIRPVYCYDVCGVDVVGAEYSYTEIMTQGDLDIANWAVGSGCDGATTNVDVATMCTNVVAGGQGFCSSVGGWLATDVDVATAEYGVYCWCRRMCVSDGVELLDSIGQWVLLGGMGSAVSCQRDCGKYCAMNVAENAGGLRNAIMLLPAL